MRRQIDTPARFAFQAWAAKDPKKRTKAFIGRQCGVSGPAAGAWLDGASRPEPHLRPVIEALTDGEVTVDMWDLPEESAQRDAAIERIRSTGTNDE
jgi:hypothetical protein